MPSSVARNDCNICCENKAVSKFVSCRNSECDDKVCSACVERYLMGISTDPLCMFCKRQITLTELRETIPLAAVDRYLVRRSEILFDRERSMFPEALESIRRDREFAAAAEGARASHSASLKELTKKSNVLLKQLREVNSERSQQEYAHHQKMSELRRIRSGEDEDGDSSSQPIYTLPCDTVDCKGLLDNENKCCICNTTRCKKCAVPVSVDNDKVYDIAADSDSADSADAELPQKRPRVSRVVHQCDKETRDTVALINRTTCPCPRCHIRIHKIEGCDQMFCTSCKCPFDYESGKEITGGFFHNPAYFAYLNAGGEQIRLGERGGGNDGPCDLPDICLFMVTSMEASETKTVLLEAVRALNHLNGYQMNRMRWKLDTFELNSRKRYLTNNLDKSEFKKRIVKRERHNEYIRGTMQIFQNHRVAMFELIISYRDLEGGLIQHGDACLLAMQKFCDATNAALKHHCRIMRSSSSPLVKIDSIRAIYGA